MTNLSHFGQTPELLLICISQHSDNLQPRCLCHCSAHVFCILIFYAIRYSLFSQHDRTVYYMPITPKYNNFLLKMIGIPNIHQHPHLFFPTSTHINLLSLQMCFRKKHSYICACSCYVVNCLHVPGKIKIILLH